MARQQGKTRTKPKAPQADLEAIGLVLLALGIFLAGFLIPVLPTGELGANLRAALTGRIGLAAYALPWPILMLGALFMMRRNPPAWPRLVAGYLVLVTGLWMLVMLVWPEGAGGWGESLRALLAGATGWLAFLPALFIVTLGLELIFHLPATSITRGSTRLTLQALRATAKRMVAARKHLKDKASFQADVALARTKLKELDKDLEALKTLYPGSAELGKWRRSVESSRRALGNADQEVLAEAEADIAAWSQAVTGFTQDRADEFRHSLREEGIGAFEPWRDAMLAQLEEVREPGPVAKLLTDLRRALAFDVNALAQRYARLTKERDLSEGALREAGPRTLVKAMSQHQLRLAAYAQLRETQASLEREVGLLQAWQALAGQLLRLEGEFPDAPELGAFRAKLVEHLRQGRAALPQFEGWHQELEALEPTLHQAQEAAEAAPVEDDGEAPVLEGAGEDAPEILIDPPDAPRDALAADALEDEELTQEAPELPEVGGIPIQLPGLDLLEGRSKESEDPIHQAKEAQDRVRKIDETLNNFKLQGRVVSAVRGPTVTRFEVEPAPGEKISRFATLSDDLALAMAVGSVRIEAPIPGKSVIGLEVPNANRDLISFREAVESLSFRRSRARLPLILGKSIDGDMMVGDLAKMPHLLIAGSTGSGKSVAVNTLVGSLIYKFLPTELRVLMIDPKMVELTPYDGIPHLIRPVVTNPNDAAGVLLGAVAHMERRYKMMSKIGAKNLDQYNEKARNLDMPEMPFIIIIIDELADLMITSPKEVESAIMRLAQMARATGMHLILATQRPSVDILTSLIKVNVPARMAFAVSSGHDSRTILDTMGAERLTGWGDMLFYQPGLVKPVRLQGPFISEPEIHNLSAFLRRQYFDDDFSEAYGSDFDPAPLDESTASGLIDWDDDKLREAAELVVNEGQASVSRLQRRLGVGHARAGKLMDSLEALAVVGPHLGSKPREVLVTLEELPNIFGS